MILATRFTFIVETLVKKTCIFTHTNSSQNVHEDEQTGGGGFLG